MNDFAQYVETNKSSFTERSKRLNKLSFTETTTNSMSAIASRINTGALMKEKSIGNTVYRC